jgi:hypothetical protein
MFSTRGECSPFFELDNDSPLMDDDPSEIMGSEFEAYRLAYGDIMQAIRASSKTDRQLYEESKEAKFLASELWEVHHYDVKSDCFEASEDLENYMTVPRNGVPRTLTRKDKRRIKGNLRRHLRKHFGILAKRGCSPRKVKGYEDGSSATVVAAM